MVTQMGMLTFFLFIRGIFLNEIGNVALDQRIIMNDELGRALKDVV
jgi:hypothetical protein